MSGNNQRTDVGAIWKKQVRKKDGSMAEVLNITINGQKFVAWVNGYKNADNHPDYKIYPDNYQANANNAGGQQQRQGSYNGANQGAPNDDLPF